MAKKDKPGKDAKKDDKRNAKAKVKKGVDKKPAVKKSAVKAPTPKKAPVPKAAAKAAPVKKAALAKKASPAKKAPAPSRRRSAPPPPPSSSGSPYWLNATVDRPAIGAASAPPAPIMVNVIPPPAPLVAPLSGQVSLEAFGDGESKVRFTFTLSANESERVQQWQHLHQVLSDFLNRYQQVQSTVAACKSNSTDCPNES